MNHASADDSESELSAEKNMARMQEWKFSCIRAITQEDTLGGFKRKF